MPLRMAGSGHPGASHVALRAGTALIREVLAAVPGSQTGATD